MGSLLVVGVRRVRAGLPRARAGRPAHRFLNPIADYGAGLAGQPRLLRPRHRRDLGPGIGASNQKWGDLPGAHTDYIFAIIGEEFGLFGTLVVLALFVTLAYVGIRIAARTPDLFVRYASAGIVVWLLAQALINIGMVLGLLPVIGIPLPLISYGGSALLPTLIALGLLLSFARTEPGAQAALRARKRRRAGTAGSRSGAVSSGLATSATRALDLTRMVFVRALLAGGGSAGHTSPLIATADALRSRSTPARTSRSCASAPRAGSRPG